MGHHLSNSIPHDTILTCLEAGRGSGDGDPLATPIVQSTTFARSGVGSNPEHQYSRVSNPTVAALEQALGDLEQALPAITFATGLAAESALFFALLTAGDHVVCGRSVYGGTTRLLTDVLPGFGVTCTFVDATNLEEVERAVTPATKLVFIETPANPTLEITDIESCARIAKKAGALLTVDNTFLTSALQRPLDHGADLSVYSTTKFVDGHSVALGGAVVTRDETLRERLRFIRKCTGGIQTPLNAWLTLNGLKTLPLRIGAQSKSAERIAAWLAPQPGISAVHYPTLQRAEHQAIANRQHPAGNGAVVSFCVEGGIEGAKRFISGLELCKLVEHVGSVETLITHPATMTHADVCPNERERCGISDGLLRLSVGLEPIASVIADLASGLTAVGSTVACSSNALREEPVHA